jgi:hypothetical protein
LPLLNASLDREDAPELIKKTPREVGYAVLFLNNGPEGPIFLPGAETALWFQMALMFSKHFD